MNEAETHAELIDPALKAAGWGQIEHSRIRREVIAPGRLLGHDKGFVMDFVSGLKYK
jgi:type I restriction enzyme, R subunit